MSAPRTRAPTGAHSTRTVSRAPASPRMAAASSKLPSATSTVAAGCRSSQRRAPPGVDPGGAPAAEHEAARRSQELQGERHLGCGPSIRPVALRRRRDLDEADHGRPRRRAELVQLGTKRLDLSGECLLKALVVLEEVTPLLHQRPAFLGRPAQWRWWHVHGHVRGRRRRRGAARGVVVDGDGAAARGAIGRKPGRLEAMPGRLPKSRARQAAKRWSRAPARKPEYIATGEATDTSPRSGLATAALVDALLAAGIDFGRDRHAVAPISYKRAGPDGQAGART